MAVLIEAISVVIRADALLAAYKDDWDAFKDTVPNETMCADGGLVRVGFMSPEDVEGYVRKLSEAGLIYLDDGAAKDLVVVDQMRGPMVPCEWIEFGHVNLDNDPSKRVAVCSLEGSTQSDLLQPEGWTFAGSLSESFGFAPNQHIEKSLTFLRRENGLDVYLNQVTGKEVYVGRALRDDKRPR
jgi:hypothetical protein